MSLPRTIGMSFTFGAMLAIAPTAVLPQQASTRCVVQLRFGDPADADLTPRLEPKKTTGSREPKLNVEAIAGFKRVVFSTNGHSARYTVNASATVVPFGTWPIGAVDWGGKAMEPWSHRVLAYKFKKGFFVSNPDNSSFLRISNDSFIGVATIARHKLSLALSRKRDVLAFDGTTMESWRPKADGREVTIPPLEALADMPSLGGIAMLGSNHDLLVLSDDNRLQTLLNVGKDEFGPVFDAPGSGLALYLGQKIVVAITKDERTQAFSATTVLTTSINDASTYFHTSPIFSQAFYYGKRHWFDLSARRWLRFHGDTLEEIGGDIGDMRNHQDLPTLKRILFEGSKGLFLYDGVRLHRMADQIDRASRLEAVDLPSIGRAVLLEWRYGVVSGRAATTPQKVSEVTEEASLKPLPAPFDRGRAWIDWPEGGGAVMRSEDGLYLVRPDLTFERLGTPFPILPTTGLTMAREPATGGILLAANDGLYLIRNAGGAGCPQ
ncbi:hypothetical protein [Beijerinckia sp. L45]|uniref:hypothetical protein n=1 Tax=Beijerinckia sp. L45 TaxID=1641855 RepID=UPI00131D22F2|nr:hypothetical protein [Beijerinckia sp. L45]